MIEGYIHSIESMGLVDGPGIRTVVFFQGCRLRCRYCHNPDTWAMRSGKEQIFTPEQLVNKLLRFKPYFGNNGGVTFEGNTSESGNPNYTDLTGHTRVSGTPLV